jgi:two-component system response regulator VicR
MKPFENWSATGRQLICVVDGESGAGQLAYYLLNRKDFEVRLLAGRGDELEMLEELRPCAAIVEVNGCDSRGLELCRSIRKLSSMAWLPVLAVSGHASEEECVVALDSGADDYVPELSGAPELLARVRAVLRRFARQILQSGVAYPSTFLFRLLTRASLTSIRAGDLEIDPMSMKILIRGDEIVVTGLEFRLIFYLAQNYAQVFTRDQLLDAVWGNQYQHAGSVNACVRRLREKLEPDPKRPTYLKTIRGVGYLLDMGGNQNGRMADGSPAPLRKCDVPEELPSDFC